MLLLGITNFVRLSLRRNHHELPFKKVWKWKNTQVCPEHDGRWVMGAEGRRLAQRIVERSGDPLAEAVVFATCNRLDVWGFGITADDYAEVIASEVDLVPWELVVDEQSGEAAVREAIEQSIFMGYEDRHFDPRSSGDAHVVAQLKHAFQLAIEGDGPNPAKAKMCLVARRILEAAKAARDARSVEYAMNRVAEYYERAAVPNYAMDTANAIVPLHYWEGRGIRDLTTTLDKLREKALLRERKAAYVRANVILPAVEQIVSDLGAMERTPMIQELRSQAFAMVPLTADPKTRRRVSKILHRPTVALRSGEHVDVPSVLRDVYNTLATSNSS